MFGITSLDVILSYRCNLNCFFCLDYEKRLERNSLLSIDFLKEVFDHLIKENSNIKCINIYGGEVMLLDPLYLKEIIHLCKFYFPYAVTGVISNLVQIEDELISIFDKYNIQLSTSYDSLRFMKNPYALELWKKNVKELSGRVKDFLVLVSSLVEEDIEYLMNANLVDDFRVHLLQIVIPENISVERERLLSEFILSPREYVVAVMKLRAQYRDRIVPHNYFGGYMFNHVHILPEGKVSIAGPDISKGYPYQKHYYIYPNEKRTLSFAPERLKYIRTQLGFCTPCEYYPDNCYAEFFYPDCCLGVKAVYRGS